MTTILYVYPESFNQLRKQLSEDHEDLWVKVSWDMANNPMDFILTMNEELDCVCVPEMGVEAVCTRYLQALKLRVGKPANKSLELLVAERTGRMGLEAIFGNSDDDGEREELHKWKVTKGQLPS